MLVSPWRATWSHSAPQALSCGQQHVGLLTAATPRILDRAGQGLREEAVLHLVMLTLVPQPYRLYIASCNACRTRHFGYDDVIMRVELM